MHQLTVLYFTRLLIHMDTRMVEQFQDEDDFLVEVNFQNKEGIFEVTFLY